MYTKIWCTPKSGVHQNLVYIKNENLVYISKGILCSQEKVLVLYQDSEKFDVHRRSPDQTNLKQLIKKNLERLNNCLVGPSFGRLVVRLGR